MVRRRLFGWCGELIAGGSIPTGIGDSAYNPVVLGTGDYLHTRGDADLNWRVVHPSANSGLGVFSWIWNHHGPIRPTVGTSPQYPNPSLDWYAGFHVGTDWNSCTEGRAGGLWPSEWAGSDVSFLLQAHGDPGNHGGSPPETLDASFSWKNSQGAGRLIPKDADILGQITAIATIAGNVVEITLSRAHGITLATTRDVWIYGLGRASGGTVADPNLRGKFTATASATNRIQVTLAAPWNGNPGKLPGGIVFSPSRRITALSNPRDNLLRIAFTGAALTESSLGAQSLRPGVAQVFVSDITGTGTNPNGRKVYVERTVSWRPLLRSDIGTTLALTVAATAKTLTRSSGTWTTTPAAGDVVRVTGSLHSDGLHRLASATTTVLTLDSSYRLFRDESVASCRVELLSRSVTFSAAAKTLTVGSGTFDATPVAGQKLVVQGSSSNNTTFTVVSATSTVITVSEAVANETSSCEVYLCNELEWDENAASTLTGWNSDGWISSYALWGSVFASAARGEMPIGEIAATCNSLDAAATAFLASDTMSPEMLAFSLGYNDVSATVGSIEQTMLFASYGDALEETLIELRTACAAVVSEPVTADEIPLVVVQFGPSPEAHPSDPTRNEASHLLTHVASIRAQTQAAVARLELATLVDIEDLPHQVGGLYLTADAEVALGQRLWDALVGLRSATVTPSTRLGVPFYVLLGQSQTVGGNNASFTLEADPDYDGTHYDGVGIDFSGGGYDDPPIDRPRLIWIWDPLEDEFQELAAQKNANRYSAAVLAAHGGGATGTPTGGITLGPGIGNAGPEQSWALSLRKRHPEGVFIYKLALNGAALGPVPGLPTFDPASADLIERMREDFAQIRAWFHAHGLIPDTRGIFFDQGEGDLFEEWHNQYAANLDAFIDEARDIYSTSSSSRAEVPFVIGRVQSHDRMSAEWSARVATVQAAQDGATTRRANVGVANMQGLPIGSDGVHRTHRARIEAGYRLADGLTQTTHADDGAELNNGAQLNPEMQAGTAEDGSPEFDPDLEGASPTASPGAGGAGATTAPTIAELAAAATVSSTDLLSSVEAALSAFLADGGLQSYSVDGFSATRAQLGELMALRAQLRTEASIAAGPQMLIARRGRY